MNLQKKKVSKIVPYDQNPRFTNEIAVDSVAKSIESYGYQQPIIVDSSNVVIAGHTRLLAVKKLGWKEVDVLVADHLSEEEVRQHRIADNKTGEMSSWDKEYLVAELREFKGKEDYFTSSELGGLLDENLGQRQSAITDRQIEKKKDQMENHHQNISSKAESGMIECVCQSCGEKFALQRDNALNSYDIDNDSKASRKRKEQK